MYTSEHKDSFVGRYLLATVFTALFGAVYEHFSHGVYSFYMIYAFAFPLLGGVAPYYFFGHRIKAGKEDKEDVTSHTFWGMAIAVFMIGCIFKGALEIYGTTSRLANVYPVAGAGLALLAAVKAVHLHK